MKIGTMELIVVLVVALLVLGPEKMPMYAKKAGRALRQVKDYTGEFTKEFNESVVEPVSKVREPLDKATKPIQTFKKEMKASFQEKPKETEAAKNTAEESTTETEKAAS